MRGSEGISLTFVAGTYTQNSGYLHARLSENHNTPFLLVLPLPPPPPLRTLLLMFMKVKKDISLSRVQVILTSLISSFFAGWQKLIMAESEAKALSAAPQILEATNQDSSIYYTVTIKYALPPSPSLSLPLPRAWVRFPQSA